ncbi:MAG: hypothetical protein M3162_01785 [Thermoproteota archaeon]|nr:hypothetical protein [Thermoproteota archaeon]
MNDKILMIAIMVVIPSSFIFSLFVTTISSLDAFAICNEMKEPNVSCDEQYNTRSNMGTSSAISDNTTDTSTEAMDEEIPSESSPCFGTTCELEEEEENVDGGLSNHDTYTQGTLFEDTGY